MAQRGPQPGDVIGERYRLDLMIGTGGMGAVWSASVVDSEERVALKFLHSQLATDPLIVQRFLLEARAGLDIQHPNVVRVLGHGFLDATDPSVDPAPWLAMELLDGKTLGDALRLRGRVEAVDALAILADVTAGTAAAHAKGIVHRDIKPGNVFLEQTDEGIVAKLLDFGISKYVDPAMDGGLTATGAVVGSALYMSPEQAAGGYNVDPRSDVWSLGVMLYRMLTGEHPLPSTGQQEVLFALTSPRELDLSALRHPRIPAAAAEIVRRCLRKKREERIPSAVELEPELRAALKSEIASTRAPDIDYLLRPASSRATVIAAQPDSERDAATSATAPTGQVIEAADKRPSLVQRPPSLPPLALNELPMGPPTPRHLPPLEPPQTNRWAWVYKAGAVAFGIAIVVVGGSIYRVQTRPAPVTEPAPAPPPPAVSTTTATVEEDPVEELEDLPPGTTGTARAPRPTTSGARPMRPRTTARPRASAAPSATGDPWRRPGF